MPPGHHKWIRLRVNTARNEDVTIGKSKNQAPFLHGFGVSLEIVILNNDGTDVAFVLLFRDVDGEVLELHTE